MRMEFAYQALLKVSLVYILDMLRGNAFLRWHTEEGESVLLGIRDDGILLLHDRNAVVTLTIFEVLPYITQYPPRKTETGYDIVLIQMGEHS
jgi:hypothetical protein